MEIECDLASIRDEDLLRKMWQQSEDFGRKKEIRSHLYKLRESRLREFYSAGGPGGDIMNPSTDLCFGKTPLTPSHGDSLVDQSFQSLKSKEVRDSESPTREIKFRNSGGVAGGVLVPDTTGWNVQTSTEVSPDGRAFRTETLAKTDGVEQLPGGRAEFAGRNEQKSSASHQGDDKNFVKKAAESSKTHLQEKIVIGDENSGRTEMKSSSVTSSSSKVVSSSSSKVISSGDPGFDLEPLEPMRLTQDQLYQQNLANTNVRRSEQQQYQRNERNERNETTSSNVRDTYQENKKYVDMDKASPEYQQHVQYLMSQPGTVVSNTVEYPKPGVKMITTVKQLPDGTTVKTKRYETEASADAGSLSATLNQQSKQRISSSTSTQKTTEKRVQDSEDVFSRLARPRDSSGPVSSRKTPETPSQEDIYSRLQKSRGESVNEQKFSDQIDQRSTQILRDTNQHPNIPSTRNVPTRPVGDMVDNVEVISNVTNKTVKKDLNQSIRNEKITSADFIQTERDRYVLDRNSPSRGGPDGHPEALAPITPGRYGRPQPDDVPTNGYTSTGVIKQSSKSSAKFSESRRFSTETVESYQHAESQHENQNITHGYPSVRRPVEEPKGRSPSTGRTSQDFSTHGFPSVRADKPTQEYLSERPRAHDEYTTTERVHVIKSDRPSPVDAYPQPVDSTTTSRASYSTNETRHHVTSTKDDFSTHGFPSVRPDTPTKGSPRRPVGFEPAPGESPRRPTGSEPGDSPKRPAGPESPSGHARRPPSDGYSTHGFPSVKAGSPTDNDSPRHPSATEPTNQGRRPTIDDYSTHGFPSVKPGRATPTQSTPQYDDVPRPPNRRLPSVDREDTVSVTSDRSNSITYEKRIDAAHQAFARSLRCASPVDSIRRDSVTTDRQTPKASVPSVRNSYSPSKRDGRSPSHESITNSESSRMSSATVTKTHRPSTTDVRRVSGPKSPIGKAAPTHVSNETIDLTLTRKITAKPTDKPTQRPTTVKEKSQSAEPILRKKVFAATEDFLASEGVAVEPIIKKEKYYQLGPSDATLPSSGLNKRQLIGTTPTTSRRPTTYNTEEEVNTPLYTVTKHATSSPVTPRKSAKPQDTKTPIKPETLYSNKPRTKPEGYVSLNRATEITEKHNQTTNKHVSYPNYIPSAPKADRSSSDRPTKNLPSPAPTTPHSAPKSVTDKPKVAPSTTSPTTKPSSSPSKPDNSTTRFTKTIEVDNAITRDTTKTRPEHKPERKQEPERLTEPEDTDEGYVPDAKGQLRPRSKRPTSDDEGFEPESPRAGSPTSDFEYRKPTRPETFDEDDSVFKRTRKTDRKTVTNEFLDTERGVEQPRHPKDRDDREPTRLGRRPKSPDDSGREPSSLIDEPRRPKGVKRPESEDREPSPLTDEPKKQKGPRRPGDDDWLPEDEDRKPSYSTAGPSKQAPKQPTDRSGKKPTESSSPSDSVRPKGSKPPLDRSETFEERCRHILGMETETTVDRTKGSQDFIDTERTTTVHMKRKPTDRSPSPQKKTPLDTVSIEDCDDDDVPSYPSERTTTKITKTARGEYPRDGSPTNRAPGDREPDDHPRDRSPTDKPYGRSPVDDVTVKRTTTSTRDTTIIGETDNRSPTRPREYPRGTSPTDKPRGRSPTDDVTVKRTTTSTRDTTIIGETDNRSPTRPIEYPRGTSPTDKPRGHSPTDDVTVKRTTTSTRDTTIIGETDNRSPTRPRDYPRGTSPTDKPRGRRPTDDVTVKRTTTSTRDTTIIGETDNRSPTRPRDYPRGTSPTDRPRGRSPTDSETDNRSPTRPRDYPRGTSPTDRPRGRSPIDDVTVKRTTTSTRDTTIIGETDNRSPTRPRDYPRGTSPTDRPRGRSPIDDVIVKRTTTSTRDTTIIGETDNRSPTRPRDYPRGTSPTDRPRGRSPIDDVTVKRTTTSTRDTTIIGETDNRSPTRPRDYPRGTSPTDRPRGRSPIDDVTVKRTTTSTRDTTIIGETDNRSPTRPRDYPRGTSPTDRPRGRSPTDSETDNRSPTRPRDYPRGTSPTDKPRGRSPTDDVTVKRTTTSTRDTTIIGETDNRSPTRPRDYPRGTSPTDRPRGRSPIDDVTVKRTTTSTRDTTIIGETDNRSPTRPRDYPRGTSPTDRPRGRSPTDSETDNRSPTRPRDYPRGTSPTDKPRGRSPTDDVTVKRTTTSTRDTTIIGETDNRSPTRPRDYPRGTSPTDKPRGRSPTDDVTVKRTTTSTRDTTIIGETDKRSPTRPREYPRGTSPTDRPRGRSPTDSETDNRSPTRPGDYPRGTSPTDKPRGRSPTDDVTVKRTTTSTRPSDRSPSPRSKLSDKYPRDSKPVGGDRSTPRGGSPSGKSFRETAPSQKPRTPKPTTEDVTRTTVQKTTRDRTTVEETDDHPRDKSPSGKPGGPRPKEETFICTTTTRVVDRLLEDRPRGTSPSQVPRTLQPSDDETDETVVERTSKTSRERTISEEITDMSSRSRPRGSSPAGSSPRERSPTEKPGVPRPSGGTVVQRTIQTTTIEDRPRRTSPSEKSLPKDYPRDRSPTEPSRGPKQTSDNVIQRTLKTTTDRTRFDDRSPKDRPRGISPTEKPRKRQPTDEEIEKTVVERTSKTTKGKKILEEINVQQVFPKSRPRGISPIEKPRGSITSDEETDEIIAIYETTVIDLRKDRPRGKSPSDVLTDEDIEETLVQRTSKTTKDRTTVDVEELYPKTRPRKKSPLGITSPRDRSPSEKPRGPKPSDERVPKGPRGSSPSEKPRGTKPKALETVVHRSEKTTTARTTANYPRETSPAEKPRRRQPTDEETEETVVDRTSNTTKIRKTLQEVNVESRSPKSRPRGTSPSEKPQTRKSSDSDAPTDEDIEETVILRTSKTSRNQTTSEEVDFEGQFSQKSPRERSPNRPKESRPSSSPIRGTSPSEKPRRRQPTEEEFQETVIHRTSKVITDNTNVEKVGPKERPRNKSPSEKFRGPRPSDENSPRATSPSQKPRRREPADEDFGVTVVQKTTKIVKDRTTIEDINQRSPKRGTSPSEKPRGPRPTEETVEDWPRGTSPSGKTRRYQPSDEEVDETLVCTITKTTKDTEKRPSFPRDGSPTDKPRRSKPGEVDETTIRSNATIQETDFEKRYPKGRPREPSPTEKPSTRRPSKTTATTTTRNRSNLEEQDLTRTARPKTQPAPRDKVPMKTTPSSTRSQPTVEKRVPAELPSPGRKPKSTFGTTTKVTTQATVIRGPATRPKPTKEVPKKPTSESRPGARNPDRKHSPSISPDSSPSRPTSEVDLESPYRSPNTSPSRKSPSPARSVKLEDITSSVVTTKKTTVSIDKSKPKVTHTTIAKFQVSPPTSPTKVISSPELKPIKKPVTKASQPKPTGSRLTTDKTTTKKVTTTRKDVLVPTDSEKDSEVPTDFEDVDTPLSQKTPTRRFPVTERKESAPVHRVTKIDKDVQKMSRSTSENIIKTPIGKRPLKHEPLEPIPGGKTSPKTERRPNKHLTTKTINLTTFDKVINSQDMENVVIDIQQAKSSREPSPNKIVPTPVSVDIYTGRPRYPDVVQEPEDEPRRKPNVKNIPIFEEETHEFVGCQITEVNEETLEKNTKSRTRKFIDGESVPQRPTPTIVTGDNVDNECLLSVHDKVTKFISTAEEVSKPKTSAPFRRDVPDEDVPEDDECLLTVDEKVNKFLKTAESVTRDVMTSTPKQIERPSIDDLDEELRTDECVLSVSEKVNKFTTKAEKLAPSAPQRSPELVARIERQISRQSDVEPESPQDTRRYPESPEEEDSPTAVRKVKQTKSLFEREEKKYTERQIDILSRPSVWDKKPKSDVKLEDIIGPEDESEPVANAPRTKKPVKDQPDVVFSKPSKPITDTLSKRKEIFENKISSQKTTIKPKPKTPVTTSSAPKPSRKQPCDVSDSRYPSEFSPRYVDGSPEEPDDVHEDVYGSSKTRRLYETSVLNTKTKRQSPEHSPTRKSSHPEIRPTFPTTTSTRKHPEDHSPSRRYSDEHYSPRQHTRDQAKADLYMETCETSEYTTRRRSSTQKYPEDRSPDRRTSHHSSPSPIRKQPVEEPEDYHFSSLQEERNKHHTTRTSYRSPKDIPLKQTSIPDDDDHDHSPARSTSTISSQKRINTHRTTSNKVTERPRRPSGHEPSTPTSTGRAPKVRGVPETIAARRNIFEKSPGDVSPKPTGPRRPSYMDPTKSSLEHTRKDSLEITKTTYSRKSSMEDEPYEASPRSAVKFGVGLKHKEEPKTKRKLSSSDIPNIEDVFDLELLEEMLNIVTLYEQRRRIRAQIRVVKKLLETKTREEVSRMTKITTYRKTSSASNRDSPIPRRDTPMRPEKYQIPDDDIDSESVIESRHIEEREEIIHERSVSPQTKTHKTVTKVTEVRKVAEPSSLKRSIPKKDEPKDSKPIWATKNILKKPSENEKVARALSAKKTTSTSSSTSRTQQTHRQRVAADEDCITSSYGIGPTDEDGRPLFGIRALKKKATTTSKTAQPSETTKVTGTVITEKYYSENGAEPVGERKVTVYSSNPEDLPAMKTQYDRPDSETVKHERLSKDGLTSVTKVEKIGKYKPGEIPALVDDSEFGKTTSKTVRRGSVKEMSEKFIRKESSSSVTEKSNNYPKAGLILRTRTNSGATADTADQYEVRGKSVEYDDVSDNECDVEIRTSRKHSKVITESEDETEVRRKLNTRSFLNSTGSKVTGVDDVLDRMRNADNVVVDGDTLEDREARALLNKFLGASVLMTGMESIIPQKELKKATAVADNLKKQEVKTTRVTKTIKTAAGGGSSSSPVARETCDFEEIWDEETLKQLLEKSTSYEERRSIRARLRQLMAEREACAELVASVKAELDNDKKVKASSAPDKTETTEQQQLDDESSGSEYEEIIEEYTASEDEEPTPVTTVNVVDKKKEEVKEEVKTKKIVEEIKKTTITKKEEPKQNQTKTIVVEKTTVIKKDATPSIVEQRKTSITKEENNNNDETSVSDNSKGESLLIPLLQGLLHKNMPQARASSSTPKSATTTTTTANQNSNNLKSSLKSNNTRFSSTSSSNNNNSLGDSGLSSELSKNSSLGQQQSGSSLKVTAQQIEDSGTESGEDLRLIAAGIRDSMQIEGIENQSDMSLIKEVTNALNRLESSLKEGKDLALDNTKKNALLALVERLQTGLTAPDKLSSAGGEQDLADETSSPEADNHRSNRQRFAKRRNRNNRHTVGVSKEELADARRYMEEMVMIENMSNCTTPESNVATTPPQFFAIQKQYSTGAILSNNGSQEASSSLFRPNQFVPSNLKQSTDAGSSQPDVQLRQKKGNPVSGGVRQSAGDMEYMTVDNPDATSGKRPLSDSYDSYSAQNNRVSFSDVKESSESYVQEQNQYNRSHHSDNQPDVTNRMSPDSSRFNRFNSKKQLMKRANTIDIPKSHRYNPEFDTDSEFEEKSSFNVKGLRGTVQVSVRRKPRQVVPNFEPKTENDHKFLAFIQKQNPTPGLGWNNSKSVSNWTNKFGNIKNVFESGAAASGSNRPKVSESSASSAKSFWKKTEEQNPPPKVGTSVLTSALKAKERNEQMGEVVMPKPIHMNKFIHNPQSAFRPIDTSPEPIHAQFKPIPMDRPINVVNNYSPTKAYHPVLSRKQVLESPQYAQSSPTKSWVKQNTATNSPVSLPWAVKPPENSVLKMAATKFESKPPLSAVQRHHSFKQQQAQKRPSLPNATQPYQYQYDGYSVPTYMSNSQPASYADYAPPPRIVRENSLTNPQAEPLVLTPEKPAYSPHSLQPFDYYRDGLGSNVQQTDMTDDDIDDMESMTEYRVEAKVMGKPVSQQAVTVGKRTSHVSDDEVFGKNSRAAKSLLSVMKNIGNGGPEKASKRIERNIAPSTCMSPDGRPYQAPIVEPLFPEVTKFETNRLPEYIGPQQLHQQVDYQKNPAYVPPVNYGHKQIPVAPPRGRKVHQEAKNMSSYFPQERPNVYQEPRRDAPKTLPLQTVPISSPNYSYGSPNKTPDATPYTAQIITDGMYMQSIPPFRQPYSGPNTPEEYNPYQAGPAPRAQPVQSQYEPPSNRYPEHSPVVNLPQIPLETSYTKVYDKPRDIAPQHQTSAAYQTSPTYPNAPSQLTYLSSDAQRSPKVSQSPQPFLTQRDYQPRTEAPSQYYQPSSTHQPMVEGSQQYYTSPKIQQSPQPPKYTQYQSYQPNTDATTPYYSSPKVHQSPQASTYAEEPVYPLVTGVPTSYHQSPKVQQSPQPPTFAQQQSPKVQQSSQQQHFAQQQAYPTSTEVPVSYYQTSKPQQSAPQQQPYSSPTEVPVSYYQSPKVQQISQPPTFTPQQSPQPSTFAHPQPPKVQQNQQPYQPQPPKVQQSQQPYQPQPSKVQQNQQQPPKVQQSQQPYQPAPATVQQPSKQATAPKPKPQVTPKPEASYRQQQPQKPTVPAGPLKEPTPANNAMLCKQASLDGRKRVQAKSQLYEKVEEVRRKSLGNVLEITRLEREAREQRAAAIKQDMYSVQQDVYSQQVNTEHKIETRQQETKVYKSSAPDDTPDIVKSSLAKEDIPILKKFGPPQRHCYIPNAYQNPLTKSETTVDTKPSKPSARKFSEPSVTRGPVIVETPSTPQPDGQDEIPRNIVFNNVSAFTSMSRRYGESSTEYTSQQNRPNKLSKCDSWNQICQLQNATKPPSPKFNNSGNALRRTKSGHTLALPKLYEAGYDKTEISEKQKTVAAYFSGQKSPNSLSRNSSQTHIPDETTSVSVKKTSINRIKTSEKASISKQKPSSGLSRSHTMPHIANVNMLDETNVEDAFEQLMNELSTITTEKTQTKEEDGGVVTTTTKVTTRTITGAPKPVSPFAKFQQLDKQNSLQSPKSPLTPTTPGGSSSTPIFRFTDPALNARAATVKDQLLQWCQSKTQEYENVQITNFSASWTDGLAFCALIHHFLPDAFDYSKLSPKQRRYNFELAFRVADEKAGIAPLLDVEDMVVMRRPDWKCVFTYVQSIYRRFRNCQ